VISQEIIARVGLEIRAEGNEFYLDIKRARNALDYAPRSLSAGVADYIRWVKRIKG
jgi:nucleoside-diphosphate-sugar epimerase